MCAYNFCFCFWILQFLLFHYPTNSSYSTMARELTHTKLMKLHFVHIIDLSHFSTNIIIQFIRFSSRILHYICVMSSYEESGRWKRNVAGFLNEAKTDWLWTLNVINNDRQSFFQNLFLRLIVESLWLFIKYKKIPWYYSVDTKDKVINIGFVWLRKKSNVNR